MNGVVLLGEKSKCEKYSADFLLNNKIKAYNITIYDEKLKITEARELKRSLSLKSYQGETRVFIIKTDPAFEAQNALLKTLEELPDDTFIIFYSEGDLLPTILSRCKVINLGNKNETDNLELLKEKISSINDIRSALLFSDYFFDAGIEFEDMILALRSKVIEGADLRNKSQSQVLTDILKRVNTLYPTIKNNNLNKRIMLDRILIQSFRENTT